MMIGEISFLDVKEVAPSDFVDEVLYEISSSNLNVIFQEIKSAKNIEI